jgi:hypothetical protein
VSRCSEPKPVRFEPLDSDRRKWAEARRAVQQRNHEHLATGRSAVNGKQYEGRPTFCAEKSDVAHLQLSEKLIPQDAQDDEQEPPGKRIKLSPPKEEKSNFSCLVLSNDGQYLVAVTGEDKCVRVFQLDTQSRLQQLSER